MSYVKRSEDMTINQVELKRLFQEISPFSEGNGMKRSHIQEIVLETCRIERKTCSPVEFKDKGLAIYSKRGLSFDDLCQYAIEKKWVEERGENLRLTEAGKGYYHEILTDNYSEAYIAYLQEIHEAFDEKQMVRPERINIMASFARGRPSSDIMEWFSQPNRVGELSKAYHLSVLKEMGYPEEMLEGHVVFQLIPELFLATSNDMKEAEVTLTVKGIDKPLNLVITRPYLNKRYAVGGLAIGRHVANVGFYPLIARKDQFPDELKLELLWEIGGKDGFCINHQLHITFDKERDTGNLYSTHQQLVKSSEIPSLSLTTYLPEDENLLKGREAHFVGRGTWNHLLQETVRLRPFPMELSSSRSAGEHVQQFIKERIELDSERE